MYPKFSGVPRMSASAHRRSSALASNALRTRTSTASTSSLVAPAITASAIAAVPPEREWKTTRRCRCSLTPHPSVRSRCGRLRRAELAIGLVVERVEELGQLGDHLVERRRRVEQRLIVRDVVLSTPHLAEVERAQLRVAEDLDLTVRRQQPGTVGSQFAELPDDTELEREPEHAAEPLEGVVARRSR